VTAESISGRAEHDRRITALIERLLGEYCAPLDDAKTVELLLNADGSVWLEQLGLPKAKIGTMRPERAEHLISVVAYTAGTLINRDNPALECRLVLDGQRLRFSGRLDITAAPVFNIRKHASAVFRLGDYVADGIMTPAQKQAIEAAIGAHGNILVSGGIGSGKTTLLNALLGHSAAVAPNRRIVVAEDTPELLIPAGVNATAMATSSAASLHDLVRHSLRMAADIIVVGETRGAEVKDMLDACNTGTQVLTTIHANSAQDALVRVESLTLERTAHDMRRTIAAAINTIIHIEKTAGIPGRRITSIVAVTGLADGGYTFEALGAS
jgi:P-type conjugative transfer ATPase TrbB